MSKKTHKQLMGGRGQAADADRSKLLWWEEARFGMFIHWGLYALPGGFWKGKKVKGIGEWIMFNDRIPLAEYSKLAGEFNPTEFNAREWVDLAKRAGMKYLVITAKHHEGFAMYRSPCSKFNIADATLFGRDPLAELAEACGEAGIKLGFYYSQDQDWHDPDGSWNDWDYVEEKKNFDTYFNNKVIPQLRELLTQYGPVGLIWFDTPYTMDREHSLALRELVHSLQPDCLVSGRVGNDLGDYGSLGDNQIPVGPVSGDYETPATMNDTWGFRSDDENWKAPETLLYLLIDLAAKGINYLLNVGPDALGRIPGPSVERLEYIGKWLDVNGEAVYASKGSPFPYEFPWGRMTRKGNKLYLIFFKAPAEIFELPGLKNRILKAYPLSRKDISLDFTQTENDGLECKSTVLSGFFRGDWENRVFPVAVLELDGEPEVDEMILQQPDGTVTLPSFMSQIHSEVAEGLEISRSGFTDEWHSTDSWISWECKILKEGRYEFQVQSSLPGKKEARHEKVLETEGKLPKVEWEILSDGKSLDASKGLLEEDFKEDSPRALHFPEKTTRLGTADIPEPGIYEIRLKALRIEGVGEQGLAVSGMRLVSASVPK